MIMTVPIPIMSLVTKIKHNIIMMLFWHALMMSTDWYIWTEFEWLNDVTTIEPTIGYIDYMLTR